MSYGKVILDYGHSLLRESDVNILKKSEWLNDAVIGFYFEYLGNQSVDSDNTQFAFYGPGQTQLLKLIPNSEDVPCILGGDGTLDAIKYAFWPVNDSSETDQGSSGSHWSLLLFSRPDNKFLHFDSYGGSNEPSAKEVYRKVYKHFSSCSTFHEFEGCCAQANGRDCGLHVIMNAQIIREFVCKHVSLNEPETEPSLFKSKNLSTATPKQAENMRQELLQLIESLVK